MLYPKKSQIEEAKEKLQALMDRLNGASHGIKISPMVRVGSIFDDIGEVAEEIGAELIFMGTHGMKGMQFITGSRALKVITNSSTPFVVVQEKGIKETGYDDIVVPLDLSKETKQKLNMVAQMAKYFDSRVHLIIPSESDEHFKNQLDRNLTYAKRFLKDQQIEFTTTVTESSSDKFEDGIIKHATKIDADLIAIMNLTAHSMLIVLGSAYVQTILTNGSQIPVMTVNPVTTTRTKSVIFS